jgi:hypothetical protein
MTGGAIIPDLLPHLHGAKSLDYPAAKDKADHQGSQAG